MEKWFLGLTHSHRGTVAFNVDLLADHGVHLGEPYTRQLSGKVRELRFHLDGGSVRITYWIASGRRIVLLTVFRKKDQAARGRRTGPGRAGGGGVRRAGTHRRRGVTR
ncbi:type II toxin-antitoxin system RelE/ParE family toxin [Streptomyces zaomyceticus]